MTTPEDNFLRDRYEVDEQTGCWMWLGAKSGWYGYGPRPRKQLAHRLFFEHYVCAIPEGYMVHHTCENKPCVNPMHLEAVTPAEHIALHPKPLKETCKHGHDLTDPDNLVLRPAKNRPNPRRGCRACERAAYHRHKKKKAAA